MLDTVPRVSPPYNNTSEIVRIIITILCLRKRRHREVKLLAKGHTGKSELKPRLARGQSGLLSEPGLGFCSVLGCPWRFCILPSAPQEGRESTFKRRREVRSGLWTGTSPGLVQDLAWFLLIMWPWSSDFTSNPLSSHLYHSCSNSIHLTRFCRD